MVVVGGERKADRQGEGWEEKKDIPVRRFSVAAVEVTRALAES